MKIGWSGVLTSILLAAGLACTPPGGSGDTVTPPPSGGGNKGGSGATPPGKGGSGGAMGMTGSSGGAMGGGGTPSAPGTPGRVTIRRLNRAEYDNTVRDLLGIDVGPSKMFDFIEDEWGDGFNNDGDVLTLSPISIEKYLTSAQFLVDKALDPAPANAAVRNKILVCTAPMPAAEADCTNRILEAFVTRAFRRPVDKAELAPFAGLVTLAKSKGETFEAGLKVALAAVLVSPDFLFRIEPDAMSGDSRPLTHFEVASRLSYFLWASMPDDELFNKAKAGMLTSPEEIQRQVRRMLGDPKAAQGFNAAMIDQWLQTALLRFAEPDVKFFPKWQQPLRAALEQEVKALMGPVLAGQVSAQELINGKYIYANKALATYYGLPTAATLSDTEFKKVEVTDGRRGGLLRGGSFLVLTSHPDTHSPTRRGVWILEKLLCLHPPAPPAMVPAFEPNKLPEGTLRQKLEKTHSGTPGCNGCHQLTDPMGFALENYDGAGLWRDKDNNLPVDATGAMPGTGEKFNGAAELVELLAKDARFPACVAKQVLTYALGRKMSKGDQGAIDELGAKFASGGFKFPSLVELVAQSPLLTNHRVDKE